MEKSLLLSLPATLLYPLLSLWDLAQSNIQGHCHCACSELVEMSKSVVHPVEVGCIGLDVSILFSTQVCSSWHTYPLCINKANGMDCIDLYLQKMSSLHIISCHTTGFPSILFAVYLPTRQFVLEEIYSSIHALARALKFGVQGCCTHQGIVLVFSIYM